ncbi:MAG: hypothetical protein N3D85_07840 [Candidatus Bathyarchaeota archaeon]|nr:hypothetical protein [Candidatus Bathyarchaeota archaeon]
MRKTLAIGTIALILCSIFTTMPNGQSATSYRDAYSGSININWLEAQRQQNPNFNPFTFVSYALSQINTKYGISFNYLKLDFELSSTTNFTPLLNQIDYYVPTFAQSFSQRLIIQLSGIRSTHQVLTQQQAQSLYSQIASRLNTYSNRIVAFSGENELEGNTTCPICGAVGGQEAFNGNLTAMIEYAKMLYNSWKQYSSIPFTHSAVAPWHVTTTTVYGGFWFDSMTKTQYTSYLNQSQDILCWTIWWNTDGAQYLGTLRSQLAKQVIVAEHNFHDPNHATGIMNNFGISNVIAFSWYCLVGNDIQVLYDWGCGTHNLYKHSWFPMAKVTTTIIPEGNYFGVLNTWHDLSLQGYQNAWSAYVYTYVYAQRGLLFPTTGYDAFECFANFEAVATQVGDIEFMTVGTSDGLFYTIGARIYPDRTFQIFFKYIPAGGGSFTVYYSTRDLTYMNTWWKLRMYHNRGTIWFIINDNLWLVQGNGDINNRIFTSITFGDRSTTVASKIYLDHLKIWTSSDGNNWNLQFEERFENNLNGWSRIYSPTVQPSFIDTTNGFYVDYSSCYSAHRIQ